MFVSFIMERIGYAIQCRRALRELSGMSDRELWDIGLVRTELESMVRDSAGWRYRELWDIGLVRTELESMVRDSAGWL